MLNLNMDIIPSIDLCHIPSSFIHKSMDDTSEYSDGPRIPEPGDHLSFSSSL